MAVVKIAGKQFLVEEGQQIVVPHLDLEIGKIFETKDMLGGKDLSFEVVEQKRGKKILVVKFRNKTRYKRVIGSKAKLTVLKSVKANPSAGEAKVKKIEAEPVKKVIAKKVRKPADKKEG